MLMAWRSADGGCGLKHVWPAELSPAVRFSCTHGHTSVRATEGVTIVQEVFAAAWTVQTWDGTAGNEEGGMLIVSGPTACCACVCWRPRAPGFPAVCRVLGVAGSGGMCFKGARGAHVSLPGANTGGRQGWLFTLSCGQHST